MTQTSLHFLQDCGAASLGACPAYADQPLALQGREHEWMFASEEGQAQVAASCRSCRTVLVSMRRGQRYGNIDALKVCSQRSEEYR